MTLFRKKPFCPFPSVRKLSSVETGLQTHNEIRANLGLNFDISMIFFYNQNYYPLEIIIHRAKSHKIIYRSILHRSISSKLFSQKSTNGDPLLILCYASRKSEADLLYSFRPNRYTASNSLSFLL